MGCDIHMYVEYAPKQENHISKSLLEEKNRYFYGFGGHINPGRNYWLFGYLAGVRSDFKPLYPVRGLPENLGFEAMYDCFLYIDEKQTKTDWNEKICTLADAKKWEDDTNKIEYHEGKPYKIKHPDYHTHSWLTFGEFRRVLTVMQVEKGKESLDTEYLALLAAMEALHKGNNDVRIVFWFDN